MPNTNRILKSIQAENDHGASNAAMNSYIEWKDRLIKTIAELRALDCTPSQAQNSEVASVIKGLEASNNADELWKGDIYNRPGNLDLDLIMRGEKLHDDIRSGCVVGGSNNEWLDRMNSKRYELPTTAKATSDNSMNNLLIYGTGGILLLTAVLMLSPSFRRMTRYCVSSVITGAQLFCKGLKNAVVSDDEENVETTQLVNKQ